MKGGRGDSRRRQRAGSGSFHFRFLTRPPFKKSRCRKNRLVMFIQILPRSQRIVDSKSVHRRNFFWRFVGPTVLSTVYIRAAPRVPTASIFIKIKKILFSIGNISYPYVTMSSQIKLSPLVHFFKSYILVTNL